MKKIALLLILFSSLASAQFPAATDLCDQPTGNAFNGVYCFEDEHCARSVVGAKECVVKNPSDFVGPPAYKEDESCTCSRGECVER